MTKSPKEVALEKAILQNLPDEMLSSVALMLFEDEELHALQEYANEVSIKRLGYNDHGPVHMRKVVFNAMTIAGLLRDAGIRLSLETEGTGTWQDSWLALLFAAMMHDVGMTVTRSDHEIFSIELSRPLLDTFLMEQFPNAPRRHVVLRSLVMECIGGHMGGIEIHSLEAGILLVADGCDMEKGRARIPMQIATKAKVGDIHKYSSSAVEHIAITPGEKLPVRITVHMSSSVGFFQVEEVLFPKLTHSPIRHLVELHAGIVGEPLKVYQ